MNLIHALTSLGFSENEATVYVTLLKNGASQAGPIVRETRLHRALVYTALERLEHEGLVTVTRKKSVQVFQPNSPTLIQRRVEQAKLTAQELIPELVRLTQGRQVGIEVRTLVGREGFVTNLHTTIESAERSEIKEICIMGGAGSHESNPFEVTGEDYPDYVRASKQKKVKKRLLISPRYAALYKKEYAVHPNNQLRILEEGLSSPSLTRITQEMVTIEMYKPEVLVVQIHHPLVATSYMDTFEALWKRGKKV